MLTSHIVNMEWKYMFFLLMSALSTLIGYSFCLCKIEKPIVCLDENENENLCDIFGNSTSINYTMVDNKTATYAAQFLSMKNACGFHSFDIIVEYVDYIKYPEQCGGGMNDPEITTVQQTKLWLTDQETKCTKLLLKFCMKYRYRGCYLITIIPSIASNSHRSIAQYVWLDNNFTLDDFRITEPTFKRIKVNPAEVSWNFKPGTFVIGDSSYTVKVKDKSNNVTEMTNSCGLQEQTVTCIFHSLDDGEYTLYFTLTDSWRCQAEDVYGACSWSIPFSKLTPPPVPQFEYGVPNGFPSRYLDWILIGALIFMCGLILLLILWYRRYKSGINPNLPIEIFAKLESKKHVRGILLLYARDCPEFMNTMVELRKYLASRTKSKVYDIFDHNLFNEIATSPHEFIESVLQDPHVNIVVISTECFEQLYQSMLQYFSHQYNRGNEVFHLNQLYRTPHWLDGIVLHALKLISYDTSAASYKKFFVVRLPKFNGLGNYLMHINPCTRFDLPGGLDTLIERVSSCNQENGLMNSIENRESLHKALYNLHTLILSRPDYLYTEILKNKVNYSGINGKTSN